MELFICVNYVAEIILTNQVAIFILLGLGQFSRHIKKIIKKSRKRSWDEVALL